jgi:hypothetical protein
MASYKINGYDLLLAFGIIPDQDKATASSFEGPADPVPLFSHDWGNGIIEYNLVPRDTQPKVFMIKGTLVADSIDEYMATTMAIESVIYQDYVTLEEVELDIKANAILRAGIEWKRITNLTSDKILVSVQLQFDEVKQDVPYKDDGGNELLFLIDNEGNFIATPQNENIILKS